MKAKTQDREKALAEREFNNWLRYALTPDQVQGINRKAQENKVSVFEYAMNVLVGSTFENRNAHIPTFEEESADKKDYPAGKPDQAKKK